MCGKTYLNTFRVFSNIITIIKIVCECDSITQWTRRGLQAELSNANIRHNMADTHDGPQQR